MFEWNWNEIKPEFSKLSEWKNFNFVLFSSGLKSAWIFKSRLNNTSKWEKKTCIEKYKTRNSLYLNFSLETLNEHSFAQKLTTTRMTQINKSSTLEMLLTYLCSTMIIDLKE